MADAPQFFAGGLKYIILLGGDVHLFGSKIFAKIWIHGLGWLEFTQ
jgi:hypothetical protein